MTRHELFVRCFRSPETDLKRRTYNYNVKYGPVLVKYKIVKWKKNIYVLVLVGKRDRYDLTQHTSDYVILFPFDRPNITLNNALAKKNMNLTVFFIIF